MTKIEFLNRVGRELGLPDGVLMESTKLSALREWDSMGKMAFLALLDTDLLVEVQPGALHRCQTGGDLAALAGTKISD